MSMATLSSKGQITIPLVVRQALGLTQGDQVVFEAIEGGYRITASRHDISRLAGFFGPYRGDPVSVEQMKQDIMAEATA
jgi:AbrB family looped-hinge helix DNA binding protein